MISEKYTTQDCSDDFSENDSAEKSKESCPRHFVSDVEVSHVDNESNPEEEDRVEDRAEQVINFVDDPFRHPSLVRKKETGREGAEDWIVHRFRWPCWETADQDNKREGHNKMRSFEWFAFRVLVVDPIKEDWGYD